MAPTRGKGPKKHASKAGNKRTKAFEAKGLLKEKISNRKRGQVLKKKIDTRKMLKGSGKGKQQQQQDEDGEGDSDMSQDDEEPQDMDQLLNGVQVDENEAESQDSDAESLQDDDLESLELDDEATSHKMDLQALKDKDPEFYKYLLENDKDLLNFDDKDDEAMSVGSGAAEDEEDAQTEITSDMVKQISKALIQHHSLKALRTLLMAFRSATMGNTADSNAQPTPFVVHSPIVFNQLVTSTLKYTPIVLKHHIPVKELPSGKFKIATQSKKYGSIQRLVKSYFTSLTALLASLPNPSTYETSKSKSKEDKKEEEGKDLLELAIGESSKLIPFVLGNRSASKHYLRILLDYWSASGKDSIRIAAFLAIRKMAVAADDGMFELILKHTYQALVVASKKTNVFTLPSINLMKNSASELFYLRPKASYQLVFTYVRQLAILLRTSTKSQSKDAYQAVYNWQMVHSVDFWSLVLSTACAKEKEESALSPLIYPLVQVSLGMIRLFPTSRFYPLHFHLIRSMLRIIQRTGTFIPLSPHLLTILDSSELKKKPKPSTQLKPLDFAYYIRAPTSYLRTRTYADGLSEELCFLLTEFYASMSLNIAFPELVIPALVILRKQLKKSHTSGTSSNGKLNGGIKVLVEKLEANKAWIEERRQKVDFAPNDRTKVANFLAGEDVGKSPLGGQLRRERKLRERQRELLERAAIKDDLED